jgi:dienelactone hydrolase
MPTIRRTLGMTAVLLLVLTLHVASSWSKPVTDMANGPKGTVEFQTLTLSATDFWSGVKTGKPVTISGELMLPKGDARAPAIILSHGAGGVTATEETWARELRSQGVIAFVVDSFSGRGIRVFPSEEQLSRAGQVYDVYQALRLLATHPRVDPARIGLMGFSRGGGLTVVAAMTRSLKAQLPEGVDFRAYLPFYPSISDAFDYGPLADRPMRIFMGTADEATSIAVVRAFTDKQRAAGADVKLFEYDGAHHSFDNPNIRQPFVAKGSTRSFTNLYHAQAHAQAKRDMKDVLMEIFGKI